MRADPARQSGLKGLRKIMPYCREILVKLEGNCDLLARK